MTKTETETQDKPLPPLAVRGIACTAMLWAATWIIYLIDPHNALAIPVPPHRTGILLSLVSTVVALCIFAYTNNLSRNGRVAAFIIWLAVIFAITSNVPFIPARVANTLTFIAFACTYLKRQRVAKRRRQYLKGLHNAQSTSGTKS